MLNKLLLALRSASGVLSLPELARRVGASETMLLAMLADLERRGYVGRDGGCAPDAGCDSAPAASGCAGCALRAAGGWELTVRGLRAAGDVARLA